MRITSVGAGSQLATSVRPLVAGLDFSAAIAFAVAARVDILLFLHCLPIAERAIVHHFAMEFEGT